MRVRRKGCAAPADADIRVGGISKTGRGVQTGWSSVGGGTRLLEAKPFLHAQSIRSDVSLRLPAATTPENSARAPNTPFPCPSNVILRVRTPNTLFPCPYNNGSLSFQLKHGSLQVSPILRGGFQ